MQQGKFYFMTCDGCGTEFPERVKYSLKDSAVRDMLAKVYRARWSREYDEDEMPWDFCPDCKHEEIAR